MAEERASVLLSLYFCFGIILGPPSEHEERFSFCAMAERKRKMRHQQYRRMEACQTRAVKEVFEMKCLSSLTLFIMILPSAIVHGSQCMQSFGTDKGNGRNINISVNVNEGCPVVVCASSTNASNQIAPSQPMTPPMSASLDSRRLIRFFCQMWKDENYAAMYLCMAKQYQRKTTLQKFTALFEADAKRTGGLEDENILAEDDENSAGHLVVVDLKFRKKKAPNRRVNALLEKAKDGYRIIQSGILPLDFDNL